MRYANEVIERADQIMLVTLCLGAAVASPIVLFSPWGSSDQQNSTPRTESAQPAIERTYVPSQHHLGNIALTQPSVTR